MEYKEYSLENYKKDAKKILSCRAEKEFSLAKTNLTGNSSLDPFNAAQWSSLSRKRITSLLLECLIKIQHENNVDMTAVLARKLLIGLCGRGISNNVLIDIFSTKGRDASKKSKDFKNIPDYIKKYKKPLQETLKEDKIHRGKIKKEVWREILATMQSNDD